MRRAGLVAIVLVACSHDPPPDAPAPTDSARAAIGGPSAEPSVAAVPQAVAPSSEPSSPASPSASAAVAPATAHAEPSAPKKTPEPVPAPSAAPSAGVPPSPSAAPSGSVAPPAKTAGAPVVRRRGPTASGESYEVWMETTGGYTAGAPGAAMVSLSAKPPFKCNAQYPYKLALDTAPAGLSYPSAVVRGMQVDGKHATLLVPFTASRAGTYSVAGTLSFSTCTADRCLVDKARVSVQVDVN
ncbi:MAG TPA: hypothetical protein VHE30_03775 [Polyangiaceae bacterium]|nr:hypothetical protein [Polyangiaceae bacterium]